ncbi:hypothetical protein ACJJVG_04560 [Pseudocitrobacter faecalis]|uniref:hypothetical protein n=1 Tax=Pseudocitrobacter faecalis TaxID=1398493 RepID=UPI00389ADC2C
MSVFLNRKTLDLILNSEFELHCLSVKIWQSILDGIELSGHGIIKQNKYGVLYLELVCTNIQCSLRNNLVRRFPGDRLDQSEKLFAEFTALDGTVLTSEGFSVEINAFSRHSPHVFYIQLPFITFVEDRLSDSRKNYLYYEFAESLHIPANVSNSRTSSSTKSESYCWNETLIELDSLKIRVNDEEEYRSVRVHGNFEPNDLYECINFYIGFSGGVLPQPYVVEKHIDDKIISTIKSINNQNTHKKSSNPIPDRVIIGTGTKSEIEHSYELFKKIYYLHKEKRDYFNSIYSQWVQVWHGFQTKNSITELVISVAIEGVLNDIYIPVFRRTKTDLSLISDIEEIKGLIKNLEISKEHKQRLIGSVSYWKNVTASKALDILISEGVISHSDKRIWSDIRNEAAHPQVKDLDFSQQQAKRDKILQCLNLFHKLMLNVMGYSGPVNIFAMGENNPAELIQNKNVLAN